MEKKYLNRKRAEGFGSFAEQYDKTRPSYARDLIEWLSADGTGLALDVGCGTGQVAIPLIKAGWNVMAIEPDERMAAIARSRHIDVMVSTFEQWVSARNDFDLITAGTSWHWVDPAVGYEKAASILKSGGRLGIFRNFYHYEAPVDAVIKQALKQHAPSLLNECVPLGIGDQNRTDSHINQVNKRKDLFSRYEIRVCRHERLVPIERWIEELTTHSPIFSLEEGDAKRLLSSLAENAKTIAENNLRIMHDTYCLCAWRH